MHENDCDFEFILSVLERRIQIDLGEAPNWIEAIMYRYPNMPAELSNRLRWLRDELKVAVQHLDTLTYVLATEYLPASEDRENDGRDLVEEAIELLKEWHSRPPTAGCRGT